MSVAAIVLAAALTAAPDTDGDGIPDAVEDADGDGRVGVDETDPKKADTDRDGVPDGEERTLKTDPTLVGIPEPLLFDTVRSLGARAGELELNALGTVSGTRRPALGGGPEVEWVFARGHAVELEMPIENGRVVGGKLSLQGTLPTDGRGRRIHGWLVTGRYDPRARGGHVDLLWLSGLRVDTRWSAFLMAGARVLRERASDVAVEVLVNPSLFFDLSTRVTVGLEMNHGHLIGQQVDGGARTVFLPQVHWTPTGALKLQAGIGGAAGRGQEWLGALRVSWNVL